MNKKRIYEFAREIEKSSKEVVDTLIEMGEDITNHMSTISEDVQFKLMEKFDEKTLTVEELAGKLNKDISEIIKKLMFSGVMATKNEDLSDDAIELIAEDYGFTVEKKKVIEETEFDLYRPVSDEKDLVERPAV